jgi:hypothetical protein
VLAAAGLAVLLGLQTWRLHTAQLETATAVTTLATERANASAATAKATTEVRSTEVGLQAGAPETRKETNDQVRSLAAQRDALLRRLRIAEDNLATARLVSSTTAAASDRQAPAGSDAAGIPGPIGEEDVAEAERADVIRLHLAACYAQYDRAQEALKGLGARSGQ